MWCVVICILYLYVWMPEWVIIIETWNFIFMGDGLYYGFDCKKVISFDVNLWFWYAFLGSCASLGENAKMYSWYREPDMVLLTAGVKCKKKLSCACMLLTS
jgi:hypothetical protein